MTRHKLDFGELRSVLGEREDSHAWLARFWEVLENASKHDRQRYKTEWLPYIERELGDDRLSFAPLTSIRQLEDAYMIAPFGSFTLELTRHSRGDRALTYLSNASSFGAVQTLRVHECQVTREGVEYLVESPFIGELEALELTSNDIGAGGIRAIALAERLSGLKTLFLDHCHEHSESYAILAESDTLAGVSSLWLGGFMLSEWVLEALLTSPLMQNLEHLWLMNTQMLWSGIDLLAHEPALHSLRSLHLQGNGMGNDGAISLANSPVLSNLERLDVTFQTPPFDPMYDYVFVGRRGASALANSKHLNLTEEERQKFREHFA